MYGESLASRVRKRLAGLEGVEEKRLFGGIRFLLNGNLCARVWKDKLVLRLGPDEAGDALRQPSMSEFASAGRPMGGWVLVVPDDIEGNGPLE